MKKKLNGFEMENLLNTIALFKKSEISKEIDFRILYALSKNSRTLEIMLKDMEDSVKLSEEDNKKKEIYMSELKVIQDEHTCRGEKGEPLFYQNGAPVIKNEKDWQEAFDKFKEKNNQIYATLVQSSTNLRKIKSDFHETEVFTVPACLFYGKFPAEFDNIITFLVDPEEMEAYILTSLN